MNIQYYYSYCWKCVEESPLLRRPKSEFDILIVMVFQII